MYELSQKPETTPLVRFEVASGLKPNCAWMNPSDNAWYVGTTIGDMWRQIENAWSHDTYGNWKGSPPLLWVARELELIKEDGSYATADLQGFDRISLIPSAESFKIYWKKWTLADPTFVRSGENAVVKIYDASDGLVVAEYINPTLPLEQPALPDGSYSLHVQYTGVVEGLRIPPDAYRDPQYDYTTQDGRSSHFNPDEYWGEVPMNEGHPLNILRAQLVANKENHDVEEYISYVTSEQPRDGEGSMLLFQVGAGTWAISPDTFISPARPVHKLDFTSPTEDSPSTPVPVQIDPLASQITYCLRDEEGDVYLGGSRLSINGARPSLWKWNFEAEQAELMGTTEHTPQPICEAMLSTGIVTGIVKRRSSDQSYLNLLTLCSRHQYDSFPLLPENRLPRWPKTTGGEPGGRSLIYARGRTLHLTEGFGKQPDPETPSFYDVGVELSNDSLRYIPGVVAHVDNALWVHHGKAHGVRATAPPAQAGSKLSVATNDGSWSKTNTLWRADWVFLQRGASLNGRNLTFGFVPGSETAVVLVDDGEKQILKEFDYRVRHIFPHLPDQFGNEQLVFIGRLVVDSNTVEDEWTVFILDGSVDTTIVVVCDDPPCECFCVPLADVTSKGISVASLPKYLYYDTDLSLWIATHGVPPDCVAIMELDVTVDTICYCYVTPKGSFGWNGEDGYCLDAVGLVNLGITDLETLPDYLVWNTETSCWTPTDVEPDPGDDFLEKVENLDGSVCYVLPAGHTLPYTLELEAGEGLCYGADGDWCTVSPPPGGGGDDGCNAFVIDVDAGTVRWAEVNEFGEVVNFCDELPTDGLYYRTLELPDGSENPIYAVHIHDCSPNKLLQRLNNYGGNQLVSLRIDSTDPIDDLESYTLKVPMGRLVNLPTPAYVKVEMLVIYDSARFAELDLPIIARRA